MKSLPSRKAKARRPRPERWRISPRTSNQAALVDKIDPLIGREKELERVIQTLCRRRKNNHCWSAKPAWQDGHR